MLVGALNQAPRFYNAPVALQAAAGAAVVLAVEFASGCILNLWLGLDVWDYSGPSPARAIHALTWLQYVRW